MVHQVSNTAVFSSTTSNRRKHAFQSHSNVIIYLGRSLQNWAQEKYTNGTGPPFNHFFYTQVGPIATMLLNLLLIQISALRTAVADEG